MFSVIDTGPPPACPAPYNMAADVLAHAADMPEKPALEILSRDGGEPLTYAQLQAHVLGAARGLLDRGLSTGDKVLVRLGNSLGFPVSYLAAIAVDMVPVPVSSMLTQGEIEKIAATIDPKLVIADPGLPLPEDVPVLTEADLLEMNSLPPADYMMGDPQRLAYIIFTSGTSGQPRAVCHAHRAFRARRMMWDGWYGLTRTDRLLHAGAFNWTFTLGTGLMDPWSIGATALIPEPGLPPEDLPHLICNHHATIFAAAPGVYRKFLTGAPLDAPDLRHGLSAGEKLPRVTAERWHQTTGTEVYEAFGMSECSTFLSGAPARPTPEGTLGYAQPGRKVAIVTEAGDPVTLGKAGILAIADSDPGLMLGYLNQPEESAAKHAGGWFLTGDIGVMAQDGAITYLGRNDDMMNAGGVRVSPIEVEQAMRAQPDITDCAAVEVRIKPDSSIIALCYSAEAPVDERTLKAFATDRLARYKQPRLYAHVPVLPRGANNKLLRRVLRARLEDTHGQA